MHDQVVRVHHFGRRPPSRLRLALVPLRGEQLCRAACHPHAIDPRLLSPRTHLPTGRISLEQVIRLAIDQLAAEPKRTDWDKVLTINDAKFQLHRSWRDPQEAPRPDPDSP